MDVWLPFLQLLGWGWLAAAGLMSGTFLLALRLNNLGIVDVAWGYGLALLALVYGWVGDGAPLQGILPVTMAGLASLRLGAHLHRRFLREHPHEDPRYAKLRHEWSAQDPASVNRQAFIWVFQLQALLLTVVSTPLALACLNPAFTPGPLAWAGAAVWLIGWVLEAMADQQLARFRLAPGHQGQVCTVGLWRYSRHPNYFGQWLLWVGYALVGTAAPLGWLGWVSPLLMLWFLLKITGVAPTEAHLLATRGEAYRRVQQTTSAFIPWFPKAPPAESSNPR